MEASRPYHSVLLLFGSSHFRLFLSSLAFGVLGLAGTLPLRFGEVVFMAVGRMGVGRRRRGRRK